MKINLTTRQPIPRQGLDEKVLLLAVIEGLYPRNASDAILPSFENEMYERAGIIVKNIAGRGALGSSEIRLGKRDVLELLEAYDCFKPQDLIGNIALTVYASGMISGLIPLTPQTRINNSDY